MSDAIGWVATALFGLSYLMTNPRSLRYLQAFAASLWIFYGIRIGALPVVVSNGIVASLAMFTIWREMRRQRLTSE